MDNNKKKTKVFELIKRCVFTRVYCLYYPLSSDDNILSLLNNTDSDNPEVKQLRQQIEVILTSVLHDLENNIKKKKKNKDKCSKTKKYKEKDEDGKKRKLKKKSIKWNLKSDEEQYSARINSDEHKSNDIMTLINSFDNGTLIVEDLTTLDEYIKAHRINNTFSIVCALIVVLLILILFFFRFFT